MSQWKGSTKSPISFEVPSYHRQISLEITRLVERKPPDLLYEAICLAASDQTLEPYDGRLLGPRFFRVVKTRKRRKRIQKPSRPKRARLQISPPRSKLFSNRRGRGTNPIAVTSQLVVPEPLPVVSDHWYNSQPVSMDTSDHLFQLPEPNAHIVCPPPPASLSRSSDTSRSGSPSTATVSNRSSSSSSPPEKGGERFQLQSCSMSKSRSRSPIRLPGRHFPSPRVSDNSRSPSTDKTLVCSSSNSTPILRPTVLLSGQIVPLRCPSLPSAELPPARPIFVGTVRKSTQLNVVPRRVPAVRMSPALSALSSANIPRSPRPSPLSLPLPERSNERKKHSAFANMARLCRTVGGGGLVGIQMDNINFFKLSTNSKEADVESVQNCLSSGSICAPRSRSIYTVDRKRVESNKRRTETCGILSALRQCAVSVS
eukprot:938114_1